MSGKMNVMMGKNNFSMGERNHDLEKQLVEWKTSKYTVEFDKVPTSEKETISPRASKLKNS